MVFARKNFLNDGELFVAIYFIIKNNHEACKYSGKFRNCGHSDIFMHSYSYFKSILAFMFIFPQHMNTLNSNSNTRNARN